jgi:hypothetical protein
MSLLWIRGGPGKGKTMLSMFLVEELEQKQSVMSYFCTNGDERRNNASAVLRSLLWQVTRILPDLAQHCLSHLGAGESDVARRIEASLSSIETLWIAFTTICCDPRVSQLAFVLDGLDECDEKSRDWLASKIYDLETDSNAQHTHPPKIIIVSRDILPLRLCNRIRLDPDHDSRIGKDVERVVSERVKKLWALGGFDEKHRRRVEVTLLRKSEGTFLWVGFAIAELKTKRTILEVERSLNELPEGLPALYRRMLGQVSNKYTEAIAKILRWTTLSARPLTLSELAEAIHCKPTSLESAEEVVRDLVTLCYPFLVVQSKVGAREATSAEQLSVGLYRTVAHTGEIVDERPTVNLIHQSARDFMDSSEMPTAFRFQPEKVHFEMAWTCMDSIHQAARDFDDSCEKFQSYRMNRGEYYRMIFTRNGADSGPRFPMLQYAMEHWPVHARKISLLAKPLLKHPSGFFNDSSTVRNWWLCWVDWMAGSDVNVGLPHYSDSVGLSAYIGFVPWIEMNLAGGWFRKLAANKRAKRSNETPLEYAAWQGHGAAMKILLEHGATANRCDGRPGRLPAIHKFAASGHEMAVRICLDYGTNLVAAGERQETPLHLAAAKGHHTVVRLLLGAGADLEAKDSDQETPLMKAARRGYGAVVRILIECGAEVRTKIRDGASALHLAAVEGHENVVTLLLDRGASFEIATALGIAASRRRGMATVRRNLDNKMPVGTKDHRNVEVPHDAACEGHNAVAQALVTQAANNIAIAAVYASELEGGETIMRAITSGFVEDERIGRVVRMCCESGADVNAVDYRGRTVLHLGI